MVVHPNQSGKDSVSAAILYPRSTWGMRAGRSPDGGYSSVGDNQCLVGARGSTGAVNDLNVLQHYSRSANENILSPF
jgi:hypothetical protein